MYVRVCICVCVYVCLYVCVRSCVLMGVCVCVLTCIYAAFTHISTDVYYAAFKHVSTDVYYLCTIHVRPYMNVAYDGYIPAQLRASNAGGLRSQGRALAAASSAPRRLHSLQFFLM